MYPNLVVLSQVTDDLSKSGFTFHHKKFQRFCEGKDK